MSDNVKVCEYCGATEGLRMFEIPCYEDCAGGCGDKLLCEECINDELGGCDG